MDPTIHAYSYGSCHFFRLKQWKTSFAPLHSQEVCLLLQSGWCCREDRLKLLGEVGKRSRAGTFGSGASSFWKEKQNWTLYQLYQQGWSQSKGDLAGSKHRCGYGSPPCQNLQQQPGEFLAWKSLLRQFGCSSTFHWTFSLAFAQFPNHCKLVDSLDSLK